jgi:glycosyltransferase involved in cell wall biosynthesis
MKILYVSESVIPSRTANSLHVMKMCEAFAALGHEVTLLAPDRSREYEKSARDVHAFYGVKPSFAVRRLPWNYSRFGWILYLLAASREIFRARADLVYARYLQGCVLPALLGRRFAFESHAPIRKVSRFWEWWLRRLGRMGRLEGLVVISEALRKAYVSASFDAGGAGIIVAHDACSEVKDRSLAGDWPGRPGALQAGYVGQLYPGKGMEVIERVAPRLPDVDFHVVGGLEKDIARWKQRGLPANVHFHGFVPNEGVSRRINRLDVCLLPNQRTVRPYGGAAGTHLNISDFTSPLKMFEYMAHRKAIVCSDLPSLREVLNPSNAVLVDPEDIEGWVAAVRSLADGARRDALAEKAYGDFLGNHTWEARAAAILRALSPASAGGRGAKEAGPVELMTGSAR